MAGTSGCGDDSDASVFICIVFARCIAIIRDIGAVFAHTGTSGDEITTTKGRVGSGPTITGRLAGIDTACVSSGAGMDLAGTMCEVIGICTDATTTITICMADTNGYGAASAELACTDTACASSIGITKAIGVVCVRTGISGVATTTTDDLGGSGADGDESIGTCTVCAS